MENFLFNISEHIIADFLFLAILLFIAWILYNFTKRKKLYSFFSISESKRLNIYLSRLNIKPLGSLAVNGQSGGYSGLTIVYRELLASNKFRENFNHISPSLSDKPGLLSKLLLSDTLVKNIISVENQDQIDNTTSLITLGSPTYNIVSGFVENNNQNKIKFVNNGTAIKINDLEPMTNLTYGFIQRIHDCQNNRSYFYVAGINELGTVGATDFLATKWNLLYKKYEGTKNFLVVIEFDIADYEYWNIISERSW